MLSVQFMSCMSTSVSCERGVDTGESPKAVIASVILGLCGGGRVVKFMAIWESHSQDEDGGVDGVENKMTSCWTQVEGGDGTDGGAAVSLSGLVTVELSRAVEGSKRKKAHSRFLFPSSRRNQISGLRTMEKPTAEMRVAPSEYKDRFWASIDLPVLAVSGSHDCHAFIA